jgi:hypothetical protein
MKWLIMISCFLSILLLPVDGYAQMDELNPVDSKDLKPKVAFIRGGELWVKQDAQEQQITQQKNVLNPQWSATGDYLSYSSGPNAKINWVYSFKAKKSFQVYEGGTNLEWSPKGNKLAFLIGPILNKVEVLADHIGSLENVIFGVGNYSWLPDGNGFLVSSSASLLPTGWTNVRLFLVPLNAHMDSTKIKPFFTLPHDSKDFFAVTISPFKWSADRKWISFIAEPTASLSSDQNTLCLLSSDAKIFKTFDTMLHYDAWFQWAPTRSSLAYIQGVDRIASKNKHLKVAELPAFKKDELGAKGFVDQDFSWNNDQYLTVSRAKENSGPYNAVPKNLPALYRVHLANNQQKQITKPSTKMGDYNPHLLQNSKNLTWVRADDKQGNLWIAHSDGSKAKEWIHQIDKAANYYGYTAWASVVAWYEPHKVETTIIHVLSDPAYAKWGQLAMAQVKDKYQADIVDYKHLGRKQITAQVAEEDFRFWLRKNDREFGVFVRIRFETSSDKVQSINIQEV